MRSRAAWCATARSSLECLGEVAQYVYDTYGRFPGTIPTMMAGPYVQAQHIDLEFYDTHFQPGAYLETHRQHMAKLARDGIEL